MSSLSAHCVKSLVPEGKWLSYKAEVETLDEYKLNLDITQNFAYKTVFVLILPTKSSWNFFQFFCNDLKWNEYDAVLYEIFHLFPKVWR